MQGVAAPRSYHVWTRAQNSTIPCIQLNVDVETTYETSEMKQPKRSGLAWSWKRRSSPQSGVVTLFEALRQHPHPPINPIITTGLTGTTPASTTRPQRSLNCGLRALLAPSPTSSLSTGLLAHSFLVRCACRPRLDVNIITFATISQQSQRAAPPAPPTQ